MKTKNKTVFLYQKPSQKAPKTLRSSISKETKKKKEINLKSVITAKMMNRICAKNSALYRTLVRLQYKIRYTSISRLDSLSDIDGE